MSAISSAPVGQIFLTAECSQMPFIGFGDDAALAADIAAVLTANPHFESCLPFIYIPPSCALRAVRLEFSAIVAKSASDMALLASASPGG